MADNIRYGATDADDQEARFLKRHRRAVALALAGMLFQSALLLPIPLIQGRVVDRLVGLGETATQSDAAAVALVIVLALVACVACYLAKTVLAWWVAGAMTRISLDVVRVLTDAKHRKLQRLPVA